MKSQISLRDVCSTVYIVAHKEDISDLVSCLGMNGFSVQIQRGPYSAEQEAYDSQIKCLINHSNVWRRVAEGRETCIVVEADFVPVEDFGSAPSPMPDDTDRPEAGFCWLYSAGSILYGFDRDGFPTGHGNTTVAYMLTPRVASMLMKFVERELSRADPGKYSRWETYLGVYLRWECGILNYFPTYCYGEHGGISQSEHTRAGGRAWHQADMLLGRLAFLPAYADGSRLRYFAIRARAYLRGWVRLALLRFYDPRYVNSDSQKGRIAMAWYSCARLLRIV